MLIAVIDGQGGRMGSLLIEEIRKQLPSAEIRAVGTNSIATAAMLKAGAGCGATGENPVAVACREADVIVGPIGILAADSLLGEITPAMAVAVGQSRALKLLLPVSHCNNQVVGVRSQTVAEMVKEAAERIRQFSETGKR